VCVYVQDVRTCVFVGCENMCMYTPIWCVGCENTRMCIGRMSEYVFISNALGVQSGM